MEVSCMFVYMNKSKKVEKLSIEVGKSYLLNNGHEVTIIRKSVEYGKFPFYSTPFEEGTKCSAFSENGINYVNNNVQIISEVVKA